MIKMGMIKVAMTKMVMTTDKGLDRITTRSGRTKSTIVRAARSKPAIAMNEKGLVRVLFLLAPCAWKRYYWGGGAPLVSIKDVW